MTKKEAESLRKKILVMLKNSADTEKIEEAQEKEEKELEDGHLGARNPFASKSKALRERRGYRKGFRNKQLTGILEGLWEIKLDHSDPDLNHLIQILKKPADARTPSDLIELMAWIKNVPFFKHYGIIGRDLLEVCEFLTYEHKSYGGTLIEFGESSDSMYIVLDGTVDFTVNLMKHHIGDKQVDELCNDLMLDKKELVKQVI